MTNIIKENVNFSENPINFDHFSHIFRLQSQEVLHVFQAYSKHCLGLIQNLSIIPKLIMFLISSTTFYIQNIIPMDIKNARKWPVSRKKISKFFLFLRLSELNTRALCAIDPSQNLLGTTIRM